MNDINVSLNLANHQFADKLFNALVPIISGFDAVEKINVPHIRSDNKLRGAAGIEQLFVYAHSVAEQHLTAAGEYQRRW